MNRELIQAQLAAKSDDIARRLGTIQDEVSTTGQAFREAVATNPLIGIGGAVAAGVLVGLVFGGSRKSKERRKGGSHIALVEQYVESVAEEARRRATRKGVDVADAVRASLKDRVPVIFYPSSGAALESQGVMADAFQLVYKTALGFAVKYAVDFATSKLNLTEIAGAIEAGEGSDAAAPVAAAVS